MRVSECVTWSYGPSTSSECLMGSSGPCTHSRERRRSVEDTPTSFSWCAMPELLVYIQALDGVARAFKWDECGCTRWEGSQQCTRTSSIGANCPADKRVPMGCSGISCNLGTKSSLGPNFYFTGGLIYSQNPTLGYMLLVPPMPLTVALAYRQVVCISTLPHPLYS